MNISHFHHELYIYFFFTCVCEINHFHHVCLLSFCFEIKTSCHLVTLLILKQPKSQKTNLSSVLRVDHPNLNSTHVCRLRSVLYYSLFFIKFPYILIFGLHKNRNACACICYATSTFPEIIILFVDILKINTSICTNSKNKMVDVE